MPTKRNNPREQRRGTISASGLARTRSLEKAGLSRVAVARMANSGELQRITRGVYAPPNFAPTEHHGLATAAARVPHGVICLLSALQFHGIGTQAPFEVWIAIDRKARKPTIDAPPLRVVRFSKRILKEGVERHVLEGVDVKITSAARTVADCFKYRNKIGLYVALEALRDCWRQKKATMDELHRAARVCRMANVMRPYLESLV
jgi:predicted transcriptional regulator of viral defense system